MRHVFDAQQWLPYPVGHVFAFFADPANLPRLMPAWQSARIDEAHVIAPPPREPAASSVAAGAGTRMTLSFRPFPLSPVRLKWDAEIDQFVWNEHFCDKQLERGPFKFWHHCHRVQAEVRDGAAGTLLHDRVEYEMPLGPLGELGRALIVKRQLTSTFLFRQKKTAELLRRSIPLMPERPS